MFHTKSRKEQLQDRSAVLADNATSLAENAAALADQLRERVAPAIGHAAENAKDWAKPRVEHGIEIAAPKLESAVSSLAPKVDSARDKIVDELLPRLNEAITAWAAASTAAKDEAVSRGQGAAAVISGEAVAKPKRKRGKVLVALGLIGAAGAAATAFMKRSAPRDDPWATPLEEPYVAPTTGRHSKLEPVDTGDELEAALAGDEEEEALESLVEAKAPESDEAPAPEPLVPPAEADAAPKSNKHNKNNTDTGSIA